MENTSIIVETEKTIDSGGIEGFKIIKIQYSAKDQLPNLYLSNKMLFLPQGQSAHARGAHIVIRVGEFYSLEVMEEINKQIRAIYQHLTEIKANKKTHWHGAIIFKNGVAIESEGITNPRTYSDVLTEQDISDLYKS